MERLPEFLIEKLEKQYGKDLSEKIIDGYSCKRKSTLRVNTLKTNLQKIESELEKNGIRFKKSDFWENALILEDSNADLVRNLEIYERGEIYFQSLSSMIPPLIVNPKENEDILDMTAAPGGKTTEIAQLSNNKSHITACEMNKIRFERLKYNIEKQGVKCVNAMQIDSRMIDDFFAFDKILLDAPCSGSGTININDENMKKYFTNKLIEKSVKSQLTLLKKSTNVLKKGGKIIYSTCSILEEENENIIREILKDKRFELGNVCFEGIEKIPKLPTSIEKTLCVMPTSEYEGFFVAELVKNK